MISPPLVLAASLLQAPMVDPAFGTFALSLVVLALGMAGHTNIEWAEHVWNPTTGCTRVSPGCDRCYMFRDVETRLMHNPNVRYLHGTAVTLQPADLDAMERVMEPSKVFVNSMSDSFHESIPDEYIFEVFEAMARAPWHLYMILTKRDARLRELGPSLPWADHVMMGVSVENADYVHRIDALRASGATRTFVSFEPLIGTVLDDNDELDLSGIDLAIAGGESGKGSRRMMPEWPREIRDACVEQEVAYHFKQWGRYNEAGDEVGKKKAGRTFDGQTYDEDPAWYPGFVRTSRLLATAERVRRARN